MIAFSVSLGLAIEPRSFAAAVRVRTPFGMRSGAEMTAPIPEGSGPSREFVAAELARFLEENKVRPDYVTLSLPRSAVALRYVELPEAATEHLSEALQYEAPKHFPISAAEMLLGYQTIRSVAGRVSLLLAAAKRSEVFPVFEGIRDAGLGLDALEFSAVSLTRVASTNGTGGKVLAVVDLRGKALELAYAQEGKLLDSRWADLQAGTGVEELEKLWRASREERPDLGAGAVVIFGDREPEQGLIEAVRRLEAVEEISCPEASSLDVARGAAFRGTRDASGQINLLPSDLRQTRRNIALAAAGIMAGALLLLIIAAAWGSLHRSSATAKSLGRQIGALASQYEAVQSMQKEMTEYEAQIAHFGTLASRASIGPLDMLRELTSMLPEEGIRLESFVMNQETITVTGVEPTDMDIIPRLEVSAAFRDARVVGPMTTTGKDKHFAIEMKVES